MAADNVIRPDEFQKGYERLLRDAGGGGDDGDMPPDLPERVGVLEAHVQNIRDDVSILRNDLGGVRNDVSTLKVDVGTMKENIRHLPTKGWAVGALLSTLAVITALVTLAPKLQSWIGTAPSLPLQGQQQK